MCVCVCNLVHLLGYQYNGYYDYSNDFYDPDYNYNQDGVRNAARMRQNQTKTQQLPQNPQQMNQMNQMGQQMGGPMNQMNQMNMQRGPRPMGPMGQMGQQQMGQQQMGQNNMQNNMNHNNMNPNMNPNMNQNMNPNMNPNMNQNMNQMNPNMAQNMQNMQGQQNPNQRVSLKISINYCIKFKGLIFRIIFKCQINAVSKAMITNHCNIQDYLLFNTSILLSVILEVLPEIFFSCCSKY